VCNIPHFVYLAWFIRDLIMKVEDETFLLPELSKEQLLGAKQSRTRNYIRLCTIIGVGLLIGSTYIKRTIPSLLHFSIAFLYLSKPVKKSIGNFLCFILGLMIILKFIGLVIEIFTNYFKVWAENDFVEILLKSMGFTISSNLVIDKIMTILPDFIAFIGILILRFSSSGSYISNSKKRIRLVKLWCWLSIFSLIWAIIFSHNFLYFPITGNTSHNISFSYIIINIMDSSQFNVRISVP